MHESYCHRHLKKCPECKEMVQKTEFEAHENVHVQNSKIVISTEPEEQHFQNRRRNIDNKYEKRQFQRGILPQKSPKLQTP